MHRDRNQPAGQLAEQIDDLRAQIRADYEDLRRAFIESMERIESPRKAVEPLPRKTIEEIVESLSFSTAMSATQVRQMLRDVERLSLSLSLPEGLLSPQVVLMSQHVVSSLRHLETLRAACEPLGALREFEPDVQHRRKHNHRMRQWENHRQMLPSRRGARRR